MSIENHPNINAAGFTGDIAASFFKYLRGKAATGDQNRLASSEILSEEIVEFVTKISQRLDDTSGS